MFLPMGGSRVTSFGPFSFLSSPHTSLYPGRHGSGVARLVVEEMKSPVLFERAENFAQGIESPGVL